MIIDFHTHTFPEKIAAKTIEVLSGQSHTRPFTDATNAGLLKSMEAAGVDLSVILPVATAPKQVRHINDFAAQVNISNFEGSEASGDGALLSFGCMHPEYEDWETELERIACLGLKGIKIHPVYQGTDIDDPKFIRILKKCGQLGLVVVTHSGDDVGFPGVVKCSPPMIRRALDAAGDVTMVLAHMGGWRNWDLVPHYLRDTKAYLDTAFSTGLMPVLDNSCYRREDLMMLDEEAFMDLVGVFGAERILFASDSPWFDQRTGLDWIRNLPLPEEQKAGILGENARKLLTQLNAAGQSRVSGS